MNTLDYLKILKDEIHTTVFATTDESGMPFTTVMDVMLADETGLYFITAKGKGIYRRLVLNPFVAISGYCGGCDTLSKKAISIRGSVRDIGTGLLDKVFAKNPYMGEIYPSMESRKALTVFQLYEGTGEYFDLSTKPITRDAFVLGAKQAGAEGYYITQDCIECGSCLAGCPTSCIGIGTPCRIEQQNCLHCGNCKEVCPAGAVICGGLSNEK